MDDKKTLNPEPVDNTTSADAQTPPAPLSEPAPASGAQPTPTPQPQPQPETVAPSPVAPGLSTTPQVEAVAAAPTLNPTSALQPVPAPTSTPTPTTASATPVPPQSAVNTVPTGQPGTITSPKKKHTGRTIFIIILLLALIGCGCVLLWYFLIYSRPETVASDAIRLLLSAENVQLDGEVEYIDAHNLEEQRHFGVKFNSSSSHLPGTSEATFAYRLTDEKNAVLNNQEYALKLGSTLLSDGNLYLRPSGLSELADHLKYSIFEQITSIGPASRIGGSVDGMTYDDYLRVNDPMTDCDDYDETDCGYYPPLQTGPSFEDTLYAAFNLASDAGKVLDDKWWEISPKTIFQELGRSLSMDFSNIADNRGYKAYLSVYDCLVETFSKNHLPEMLDLYEKHPFVVFSDAFRRADHANDTELDSPARILPTEFTEVTGESVYGISLDYDALAAFLNALKDSAFADELIVCANKYVDARYSGYSTALTVPDSSEDYEPTNCMSGGLGSATNCIDYVSPAAPRYYSADDIADVDADDLEDLFPGVWQLYFRVENFSHRLTALYLYAHEDTSEMNYPQGWPSDQEFPGYDTAGTVIPEEYFAAELNFRYDSPSISAPADAHPLSEAVEQILPLLEQSPLFESPFFNLEDIL